MDRSWWWRVGLVAGCIILAGIFALPNLLPGDKLPSLFPDKKLSLGLDLQGGLHLQYSVEVDKAVSDRLDKLGHDIMARLTESNSGLKVSSRQPRATAVDLIFEDHSQTSLIDSAFMRDYPPSLEREVIAPGQVRLSLRADYVSDIHRSAVQQAMETIRNRVDAFGVAEPTITTRGDRDIIVQLPGLSEEDFERAKNLIGRTAQLEFKIVDDDGSGAWVDGLKDLPADITTDHDGSSKFLRARTKEQLQDYLEGKIPSSHVVGFEQVGVSRAGMQTADTYWRTYYLHRRTELTGESINDASVSIDQRDNRPFVSLTFDTAGARTFGEITQANVKNRMAIMLDDLVNSAPVINEAILGGRAQITLGGMRDYQSLLNEANDLVTVLQHGALPAPVHRQFETRVGPSLGQDSIKAGQMSIIMGAILVVLFMVFYYKKAGLYADVALSLNLLFIVAILTAFEATLTLPGIAGIVLTIGMAVDANVIIYERIREELRLGKTPKSAVQAGYGKALSAILDANITTAIAGFVLLQYGSGPIKGFAVTLLVGIACSVFTALVVTRLFFDFITNYSSKKRRVERLSI